jgi:DNA primase
MYRKGSDRELFQQLDVILSERKRQERFSMRREQRKQDVRRPGPGHPADQDEGSTTPGREVPKQKRPHYEMEIIRLLLQYGENMRKFIGHNIGEDHFEDMEIRNFYRDIMKRQIEGEVISVDHYMNREKPYPSLLGDILLERYSVSEGLAKRTGGEYRRDRNPILTAKSTMKPLRLKYCERKRIEISEKIKTADSDKRTKLVEMMSRLQKEISRIQKISADELFEIPDYLKSEKEMVTKTFEYKMKGER